MNAMLMATMYTHEIPARYLNNRKLAAALRQVLGHSDFEINAYMFERWTVKTNRKLSDDEMYYISQYAHIYRKVEAENNLILERAQKLPKYEPQSSTNDYNAESRSTTNDNAKGKTILFSEEPDTENASSAGQKSEEEFDVPQLSWPTGNFPSNMNLKETQSLQVYTDVTSNGQNEVTTQGLYTELLDSGETSKVFSIMIRASPSVNDKIPSQTRTETHKVAVKRLHSTASLKRFRTELHSLRSMNALNHPNIVQTLSVFKCDQNTNQYFNFAFPLARGNLKRLFRGNYNDDHLLQQTARMSLWSQFLGLASALAYMHGKVKIAHRDIKPSNILIYEDEMTGLILKITDFGLSIDLSEALAWELGTLDLFSAWSYDPPEVRRGLNAEREEKYKVPTPKELLSNDIWKLGCVFTELLAYLVGGGSNGVSLLRNHITTTEGNMSSDFFNDTRFDDGEKVKPQVHEWLEKMAKVDNRARYLQPTIRKMLASSGERPSAEEVCYELIESRLSETKYHDGIRIVQFTHGSNVEPPTAIDRLKLKCEAWLDCPIDWRPFRGISPICSVNQTLVNWTISGYHFSLALSNSEVSDYKSTCVPIFESGTPIVPSFERENLELMMRQPRSPEHNLENLTTQYLPRWVRRIFGSTVHRPCNPDHDLENLNTPSPRKSDRHLGNTGSAASVETSRSQSSHPTKDVYWCNDKVYTEPLQTMLYEVNDWDSLQYDENFYGRVNEVTRSSHGGILRGWLFSLLSWKRCTRVDFVKFYVVINDRNQVLRDSEDLPPPTQKDYEHGVPTPREVHMRLASLEIVQGLIDPRIGAEKDDIIRLLPRKKNPPSLLRKQGVEGWGLHARMGFSVHKFCGWIIVCFLINAAFVIVWLICINPTDLQNAFVPAFIVTTALTIGLATMQGLER
ncbi:kinase-like domain-containing protein [Xylaria curta]|nr:kinase-like domain-containing protein [Xylaria curta]